MRTSKSPSIKRLFTAAAAAMTLPKHAMALEAQATDLNPEGFDNFVTYNGSQLEKRATTLGPFASSHNLPGYGNQGPGGFGLLGGVQSLALAGNEPAAPGTDSYLCPFVYDNFLSGPSASSSAVPYVSGTAFEAEDVQQGGVGDCGLGAALLALRSNRQNVLLSKALVQVAFPPAAPVYRANFYTTGKKVSVYIDDKLPTPDPTNVNCGGRSGLVSFAAPRGNYYVPLFEKAWAKYIDAYPTYRWDQKSDDSVNGYPGLEGIRSYNILRGVTGLKRRSVTRRYRDEDTAFLAAMVKCINGRQTCVFDTPNSLSLADSFPEPNRFNISIMAGALAFSNGNHSFTVIDIDQQGKPLTIVGSHFYALMKDRTSVISGSTSFAPNKHLVTIGNPWGCNPGQMTENVCVAGTTGDIQISLRALATVMKTIETVEA